MTARHIIQATILERGVVQREPDGYRIGRRERPIRNVEMEGRRITVRLLDQGLVVPDPDAIDTRQVCDEFPEPRLQQQAPYRLVGLPEIIALGEDLIVVLLVFRSRGRRILLLPRRRKGEPLPSPLIDRAADRRAPLLQFRLVQEMLNDQEPLRRVALPLPFRYFRQHRPVAFLSFPPYPNRFRALTPAGCSCRPAPPASRDPEGSSPD